MPFLNSNLKTLIALAKINESELSRCTGVAQPVINRLVRGQSVNPKMSTIKPLAHYFMVTVSQLIGEQSLPADQSFYHRQHEQHVWNRVPLIEWADTLEWPAKLSHYQEDDNSTYVSTDAKVSPQAYALTLQTCIMEPLLCKGTVLIVDPKRQPQHRHFVVVRFNTDTAPHLRQVLMKQNTLFCASVNPDLGKLAHTALQKNDTILATVVQTKRYY